MLREKIESQTGFEEAIRNEHTDNSKRPTTAVKKTVQITGVVKDKWECA